MRRLGLVLIAIGFGAALSRIGFTSWDEVHGMFTFSDLRLLLTFVTAVVVLAVSLPLLARLIGTEWNRRPLHPGVVPGGLLFGVGWAISGACPSIAFASLGEGKLLSLVTIAGIFLGNTFYAAVHRRWFRWSAGSC